MSDKKAKVLVSYRIDPDHLKEADKKKIDLLPVVRDAIAKAVGGDKCPTCGQSIKAGKKK